jgi:hypothetical protein
MTTKSFFICDDTLWANFFEFGFTILNDENLFLATIKISALFPWFPISSAC